MSLLVKVQIFMISVGIFGLASVVYIATHPMMV